MWRMIDGGRALALGIVFTGIVAMSTGYAADPAEAQAQQAAPKVAEPVPPAEAGLSRSAIELNNLEQQISVALRQLELTEGQARIEEAQERASGVKRGTNEIPELIGISGVGRSLRAKFLSGNSVVVVGPGEWVSSEWRVDAVTPDGVQMLRRDGKSRYHVAFGHKPAPSSLSAPSGSAVLDIGRGAAPTSSAPIPVSIGPTRAGVGPAGN